MRDASPADDCAGPSPAPGETGDRGVRGGQAGLLAAVSAAHLVSHLHILTVPALLPVLPAAYGVSFADLGLAVAAFNVVSTLAQTPLGFMVDRYGPRPILLGGLLLGSASFLSLTVFVGYLPLLLAMVAAGVANGVYHPADYSLLARGIEPARMGRAFSVHTFAGFLGNAVAPLLLVAALAGGTSLAFSLAGLAGLGAFVAVLAGGRGAAAAVAREEPHPPGRRIAAPVFTPAIAGFVLLFVLLSLSAGPIERFSVSALVAGYGVSLGLANTALIAFLLASAVGVLAGGFLADRTSRHGFVAGLAYALSGVLLAAVAALELAPAALVGLMGAAGFLMGVIAPSRDMLVRAAAPPGQEGKVFGIVTTGFNIGGVIGPPLFGLLLDRGHPAAVLWTAIGFVALTLVVLAVQERYATPPAARAEGRS